MLFFWPQNSMAKIYVRVEDRSFIPHKFSSESIQKDFYSFRFKLEENSFHTSEMKWFWISESIIPKIRQLFCYNLILSVELGFTTNSYTPEKFRTKKEVVGWVNVWSFNSIRFLSYLLIFMVTGRSSLWIMFRSECLGNWLIWSSKLLFWKLKYIEIRFNGDKFCNMTHFYLLYQFLILLPFFHHKTVSFSTERVP